MRSLGTIRDGMALCIFGGRLVSYNRSVLHRPAVMASRERITCYIRLGGCNIPASLIIPYVRVSLADRILYIRVSSSSHPSAHSESSNSRHYRCYHSFSHINLHFSLVSKPQKHKVKWRFWHVPRFPPRGERHAYHTRKCGITLFPLSVSRLSQDFSCLSLRFYCAFL